MTKIQEFKTFINHWAISYNNLEQILNNEQQALESRDFTKLASIVKEKNKLVIQINEQPIPSVKSQNLDFKNQLSNNKITPIKESAISKLNHAKNFCLQNEELRSLWNNLIELVDHCNYKNEVNSKMVDLITLSTKRTFNLIKGFDPDNNLYNQDGDRSMVQTQGQPLIA